MFKFKLTDNETIFIALSLEGFFYGLYSGIFAMYLQYQASKKGTGNKIQNIIFYSICSLYVFSIVVFVSDISSSACKFLSKPMDSFLRNALIESISFGFCDFIAQFILIYRCWIVWGRNIRIVIMPSILTLTFLVTWLSYNSSLLLSHQLVTPGWEWQPLLLTSLIISLTVNALVTGLIVFRIFKVFREVKTTSDDQILGATGGSKLQRTIFILIESGMALFSVQLVRLVVSIVWTDAAVGTFNIIVATHQMLNGITPTIILVRTSMGLSFHDEESMEEVAIGSLRFASNHPNSVTETESTIEIVGRDNRDDDDIDVRRDIDAVER